MSEFIRTVTATIVNRSDQTLTLFTEHLEHGGWDIPPPASVAPGATSTAFVSQTIGLFTGTEGWAAYKLDDGSTFRIDWDNPFVGPNEFSQVRQPQGDQTTTPTFGDPHDDDATVIYTFGPITASEAGSVNPTDPNAPPIPHETQVVAQCNALTHVSKAGRYDRCAAVEYAAKYWDKVVSDGYIAILQTPNYLEAEPGSPIATPSQYNEEDCTHFTSCCIGQPWDSIKIREALRSVRRPNNAQLPTGLVPQRTKAGGLPLKSTRWHGAHWLYGFVSAPELVMFLTDPRGPLIKFTGEQFTASEDISPMSELEPGDMIAVAWKRKSKNTKNPVYTHIFLYLGDGKVAAHTASRFNDGFPPYKKNAELFYSYLHVTY